MLGSVGPGTRLPSLGHIAYQPLEDALAIQCAGLIAGGVDAIIIETSQDPLQIKAAVNGAKRAREDARKDTPILAQVTVETTGTLLVGADIAAAATIIHALDVPMIGLNCATGPREMAEHVKWLGENWPGLISVQPNAGLPELVAGQTRYPLGAAELAQWLERFVLEDGVNMIGGCCGTEAAHIAALDAMLRRIGCDRPRPPAAAAHSRSGLPPSPRSMARSRLRQENAYLSIGERCNANGSRQFRRLQEQGDWDGCVEMGREQVKEGSHTLDLCTAFVGRDEIADMTEAVTRLRGAVNAPLVIDSTEYPVLEAALALYGGKPIINSINFEDGEEAADKRLVLARRFGAAVIALTIDETGMAKEVDHKLAVARRLYDFACGKHGLPPSDLLFDPLTFTICTGNEDDRRLGLNTLEAIERISRAMPECQIILGLSNISFGLNPPARHVLNSVFLDHALKRGLTGAIVHFSRIMPLHKIPEEEVRVAEDLIFDRRREGYDPLQAYIALFEDRTAEKSVARGRPEKLEDRLGATHRRRRPAGARNRSRSRDGDIQAARHHQQHPARRHEDGRRPVRRRQDAAALRAAIGRDDEDRGALARTAYGAGRGAGERYGRAGDRAWRRARHRQEPRRHHPDQQRLSGRQSRHQAADRCDPRRRSGAQGGCRRHVGAARQIDRRDAREPRGDEPARDQPPGHARRCGIDPALCRGGLRQGLCKPGASPMPATPSPVSI